MIRRLTDDELHALSVKMAAASAAPWTIAEPRGNALPEEGYADKPRLYGILDANGDSVVETDCGIYPPDRDDAELIIALRNAAPALIYAARTLAKLEALLTERHEIIESMKELP